MIRKSAAGTRPVGENAIGAEAAFHKRYEARISVTTTNALR
jgi:hypothetical protein